MGHLGSLLCEAYRLGAQSGRYEGRGQIGRLLLGLRLAWNELLYRLGIGGVSDA